MEKRCDNGRTHDPTLRELTEILDRTKELLLDKIENLSDIMDERDRLYKERYDSQKTAVDDALAAQKEQTAQSFAASEKAIVKAEDSQRIYNQGHNDLTHKMEVQYTSMVPQAEAKLKWDAIDKAIEENRKTVDEARNQRHTELAGLRTELMKEIQNLRESRSIGEGNTLGLKQGWNVIVIVLGLIISAIAAVAALGLVVRLVSVVPK
jgi:hypothetical protein